MRSPTTWWSSARGSSPLLSSAEALRRALRLAARGRYGTSPNPMVGALLVRGGEVVGSGWHRRAGGPHAEVEALRAAGPRARGATLFVTLEPCNHHGRTAPCTEAILAAGVARVVACHRDPNPLVSGNGLARLCAAGVAVEVGELAEPAVRLNLRFLAAATEDRPAVTLKWAMSLDGRIATAAGQSQWITSPAGRRWALALREEHDATLVGIGTLLADDPRLDRRLGLARAPGVRVVLDRRLRTPPGARLFAVPGPVILYAEPGTGTRAAASLRGRGAALEECGATIAMLRRVTPAAVLADLAARGVRSVLVEGGAEVLASFAAESLFDQVAVACAPLLIAGRQALGPLGGPGFATLAGAARLDSLRVRRKGDDLVLTGVRQGLVAELVRRLAG